MYLAFLSGVVLGIIGTISYYHETTSLLSHWGIILVFLASLSAFLVLIRVWQRRILSKISELLEERSSRLIKEISDLLLISAIGVMLFLFIGVFVLIK